MHFLTPGWLDSVGEPVTGLFAQRTMRYVFWLLVFISPRGFIIITIIIINYSYCFLLLLFLLSLILLCNVLTNSVVSFTLQLMFSEGVKTGKVFGVDMRFCFFFKICFYFVFSFNILFLLLVLLSLCILVFINLINMILLWFVIALFIYFSLLDHLAWLY